MVTNQEQILAILSKHLPSGSKTIDETLKLEELGLASLDVVEIIFEIEETFQIEVPYVAPSRRVGSATGNDGYQAEFETVHDIIGAVERILACGSVASRNG